MDPPSPSPSPSPSPASIPSGRRGRGPIDGDGGVGGGVGTVGGNDCGECRNGDHRGDDDDDDCEIEVDEFFGPQDGCLDRTGAGGRGVGARRRVIGGDDNVEDMAGREMRAEGERLRKMGYHEAYDRTKEVRLQEGFELGYVEAFDRSFEIGRKLGLITTRAALLAAEEAKQERMEKEEGIVEEAGDDVVEGDVKNYRGPHIPADEAAAVAAAAQRAASIAREFIDSVTAVGNDRNGDGDGSGGHDGGASVAVGGGEDGGASDHADDGDVVGRDVGAAVIDSSSSSFAAAAEDAMRRMDLVSMDAGERRSPAAAAVCSDARSMAEMKT